MKALVYHGDHQIALEEKPKPTLLKSTDVIVKVVKTTICGTDLGIYKGKNPEIADGRILGHEAVGTVTAVGAGVRRVAVGEAQALGDHPQHRPHRRDARGSGLGGRGVVRDRGEQAAARLPARGAPARRGLSPG